MKTKKQNHYTISVGKKTNNNRINAYNKKNINFIENNNQQIEQQQHSKQQKTARYQQNNKISHSRRLSIDLMKTQQENKHIKSQISDSSIVKQTKRLSKYMQQINQHKAEQDKSNLHNIKSYTTLISNKLTKNDYMLRDSILLNRVDLKVNRKSYKSTSKIKGGANSLLLQRYSVNIQKINQNQGQKSLKEFARASIPNLDLKRSPRKHQRHSSTYSQPSGKASQHSLKFKLLFRQKSTLNRKTKSQRRISRIQHKIKTMEQHKRHLSTLLPKPLEPKLKQETKPRGTIVGKEKIMKLADLLITNTQLYFNMHQHPKKVGDLLKAIDGYNRDVHNVLFSNQFFAKRIFDRLEICQHFWVYKQQSERPKFYGEEDLNLFNSLQNFGMKMDKGNKDVIKSYSTFQHKNMEYKKKQMYKAFDNYHRNKVVQPEIRKINDFIEKRRIFPQQRREASLSKLESLGVRFNVEQRSKQLIIRQKEKITKKLSKELKHII